MPAGDTSVMEGATPRLDEAFQKLLLRFSAAAAKGIDAPALIRLFCRATREFFRVDGTYFWSVLSSSEMVGTEADGLQAESFRGKRLKASQSAVALEAVRLRKTVYVNRLDPARYPLAGEFRARSLMAAPLVVSNEGIGAAGVLHASDGISSPRTYQPRRRSWLVNWAAYWKPAVSLRFHVRSAAAPKSWPKWPRRSIPCRLRLLWSRPWRIVCGSCCALAWYASCYAKEGHSACVPSRLNRRNWQDQSVPVTIAKVCILPLTWRCARLPLASPSALQSIPAATLWETWCRRAC